MYNKPKFILLQGKEKANTIVLKKSQILNRRKILFSE